MIKKTSHFFCALLFLTFISGRVDAWRPLKGDFSWDGKVEPLAIPHPIPGQAAPSTPGVNLQPYYGTKCGSKTNYSEHIVPDGLRAGSRMFGFGPVIRIYQACEAHDLCYERQAGKDYCDRQFRKDIEFMCYKELTGVWRPLYPECREKAQLYYQIMAPLSYGAYRDAERKK